MADKFYAGFGLVNFPVRDPSYEDLGYGLLVVRLCVIDTLQTGRVVPQEPPEGSKPRTDDAMVGLDIFEAPEDAFDYIRVHTPHIVSSYMIGNVNWSGLDPDTDLVWKCAYDDLTEDGKAFYTETQLRFLGYQLVLLTGICTTKELIQATIVETKESTLKPIWYDANMLVPTEVQ